MKNIKIKYLLLIIMAVMVLGVFSSCDSNDSSDSSGGAPVITSVALSEEGDLVPVTLGDPKNYYIIQGTGLSTVTKIYFNDFDTYFNPTLVTDTAIFVLIDEKTPYANSSNKLKLVTKQGTVLYDFVVAPPTPKFDSFNSINAAEGDVVTVYGDYFLNPTVKVGTVDVPVISSTLTQIKFKMPANATDKYVSVTNISGTTSSQEAIGSALYDDILQGDAGHWMWDGKDTFDTNFKDDKVQGEAAIKFVFGGWNGADMKFNSRDISKYKAFRVKVKSVSTNTAASIIFVFGGWAYQIKKPLTSKWTTIEIPFSDIGNPTTFDQLTLQESGSFGGNTILMDDMGFVLK
ncbi:IPT/TIG domain-containing protein [Flavobacterium branchiicola]|uniref:IPT/TIG domain-containing protein n=1 Tax=Flavobacterium branchiicola TaxID=1114875 RepID=A0ABV9PH69_9FLAO|nr:IPT/TIG domain-containing protein [Flavobacterium branchiicola]MBS7254445.1 IPT/TIG domain-containing protein [Flavobacterium branchiicola]